MHTPHAEKLRNLANHFGFLAHFPEDIHLWSVWHTCGDASGPAVFSAWTFLINQGVEVSNNGYFLSPDLGSKRMFEQRSW